MQKIITGIKPTGDQMHLGNLLGAVLPFKEISKKENIDSAIFIPDLHALNGTKNGKLLKERVEEILIEIFSIYGLETKTKIFIESDIKGLPKLQTILNNFTPYSLMLRAHAFKDSEAKGQDLNMGVFNYPILMASDIIGYDIDMVPVGKDQAQHLEMTRDIARNINKEYNSEIVTIPETYIKEEVGTIPGLDGRKMSKSYDNFIGLFDDDKTLKKKVMSIPTDSKGLEDIKDPDECNVFNLIRLFGESKEVNIIREKYLAGGYGYGHAKLDLLEILIRYLAPFRENRKVIEENKDIMYKKIEADTIVMNERMDDVLDRIGKHIGV